MVDISISSSKQAIVDAALASAVQAGDPVPAEVEPLADDDVVNHTWKSGEVITAVLLNALEQNAANALNLAKTNEENLGSIQGTVEAIVIAGNTPKVNGAAVADKTIKAAALADKLTGDNLSLGNGIRSNPSTKMIEVPIDATVLVYGTNGIDIKDGSLTPALLAGYASATGHSKYLRVKADGSGFDFVDISIPAAPTADTLSGVTDTGKAVLKATNAAAARTAIGAGTSNFSGSYNDLTNKPATPTADTLSGATATGKAVLKAADAAAARTAIGAGTSNFSGSYADLTNKPAAYVLPKATNTAIGGVKPDGSSITVDANGTISAHAAASYAKQTATVPDTLAGLRVSHLRTEADGTLVEGVFDLTNSGTAALAIPANTVFATGLTMKAAAATYSCLQWGSGEELTLSANATGKSLSFTTALSIPAGETMHIYVRDNEG